MAWTADDYREAARQATDRNTRLALAAEANRIEDRERGLGSGW